jgi:hypothetical protein
MPVPETFDSEAIRFSPKYEAVRFRYTRCSLLIQRVIVNFSKKLVASTLYLWYTCSAFANRQWAIHPRLNFSALYGTGCLLFIINEIEQYAIQIQVKPSTSGNLRIHNSLLTIDNSRKQL